MKIISLLISCTLVLLETGNILLANDAPVLGKVYSQKYNHALTYKCTWQFEGKATVGEKIFCEFTQDILRLKHKTEKIEKIRKRELELFKEHGLKEFCSKSDQIKEKIDSHSKTKEGRNEKLQDKQKFDIPYKLLELCKEPTFEKYKKFVDEKMDMKSKTCLIASHNYERSFKLSNNGNWILDGKPSGECDVVELDRFELEKEGFGKGRYWNYFSQKVILNPDGKLLGQSCGLLDQNSYKWSWRSRTIVLDCDRFEFSVF